MRVADIGLGSNAGRITSIRSLPDADEPKPDDTSQANKSAEALGVDFDVLSADDRDALNGDHVNLEVSFAYQGLPSGRTAQSKAQNIQYVAAAVATLLLSLTARLVCLSSSSWD